MQGERRRNVHSTVREITGNDARDVATFARDYANAFISRRVPS